MQIKAPNFANIFGLFNSLRGNQNPAPSPASTEKPEARTKLADTLRDSKRYDTEEQVAQNFTLLTEELRTWVHENSTPRNAVLLDLLLKEKEESHKTRRDGMPNASHEVLQSIMFIRDLEDGMQVNNPDRVLGLIISHDLGEDFGYWPEDMKDYLISKGIADDQEMKEYLEDFQITSHHFLDDDGHKLQNYHSKAEYVSAICQNPNTAIAKFYDNIHNINTAVFGFKKKENLIEYVSRIQALMPDNFETLQERHPSQRTAYRRLFKMLENAVQPVVHWMAGDVGQELDIKKHNKPRNQTKLPMGLDTPEIGTERVRKVFHGLDNLFQQEHTFDADNGAQPV